jgi:hypothetical protein
LAFDISGLTSIVSIKSGKKRFLNRSRNAEVTIIASAREDPTYGLPGVGHRKRDPRTSTPYTKIGNHFLISAGLDPHRLIASSKWRTRAWTYQEFMVPKEIGIYRSSSVL